MADDVEPNNSVSTPVGFDEYVVTLGDVMRGERATLGLTLDDVAAVVRIRAEYLEAIENGDASVFPTPSFISGYVRSYAKYIGLDPQKSYERFCDESGFTGAGKPIAASAVNQKKQNKNNAQTPQVKKKSKSDDALFAVGGVSRPTENSVLSSISVGGIFSALLLVGLIGAVGYGGWSVLQEVQRVQFAPVDETPRASTQVAGLDAGLESKTLSLDAGVSPNVITPAALENLYRPQELEVPQFTPRDGPIMGIDPDSVGALAVNIEDETVVSTPFTSPKVIEEGPLPVDIVALRPAWIRVYQDSGSILFERTLDAGQRYRVPADVSDALLRAGNSGSVYLKIGDEMYGPVGYKTGVAKRVPLEAGTVEEKYQVAENDLFDGTLEEPVNAPQLAVISE